VVVVELHVAAHALAERAGRDPLGERAAALDELARLLVVDGRVAGEGRALDALLGELEVTT
jgi:hypothetical protein